MNWQEMQWLNSPPRHDVKEGTLALETGHETDFWQKTYYGFQRDNGHFLHVSQQGEFTAETAFTGCYEALYDQAGLMIRKDAMNWMKCGIEYTDGVCHFSTVVTTSGQSDWSAFELGHQKGPLGVKVSRLGDSLFVQYRMDPDSQWKMARLAFFPADMDPVDVGIFACSPQRAGFKAGFHHFSLREPDSRDIH